MSKVTSLRFGDCVVFYGAQIKRYENEELLQGLLSAEGFGQDQVYLETVAQNLADEKYSNTSPSIKNYRECVFQMYM